MASAVHLLLLVTISVFCGAVCAGRSTPMPEDNPQACTWDIKICDDGTWVYRAADRDCEFDDCLVEFAELGSRQHSNYTSPTLR
ncbi:hypothetical protein PF003_g8162 [Phytophthora fragariae]|uniref:Uncharacterized protein n=1 Tax=Phytophthora fragariae TaxID=53985 RepID=A0A6A3EEH6_9STRA|nr:hypothetical protein PF003_g8162 [Phytophthora fragariae]KAE8930646.1 hypothetical protein PF009_g19271 [Phytophthora fragariae]